MRLLFALFLLLNIVKAEDFITKMEYAKMLYSNPRGIGCDKCPGPKGEGALIATYRVKGKKKELRAPAINALDKEKFFKALERRSDIMPTYFLTRQELESLYFYVTHEVNQ